MAEEPPNILSLIQKSVRTVNRSLQDVKESYVSFVNANPETVTQVSARIVQIGNNANITEYCDNLNHKI